MGGREVRLHKWWTSLRVISLNCFITGSLTVSTFKSMLLGLSESSEKGLPVSCLAPGTWGAWRGNKVEILHFYYDHLDHTVFRRMPLPSAVPVTCFASPEKKSLFLSWCGGMEREGNCPPTLHDNTYLGLNWFFNSLASNSVFSLIYTFTFKNILYGQFWKLLWFKPGCFCAFSTASFQFSWSGTCPLPFQLPTFCCYICSCSPCPWEFMPLDFVFILVWF